MPSIQIVKLSPDQWQQYRQIRLESLQSDPQAFGSRYDETARRPAAYWQERLAEAQAGKTAWLLFAKEDDRLIGMIGAHCAEDEKDVVEIISVFISKDKRGLGAGNLLMSAILDEVIRPGIFRKAVLGVNASQASAVALYRRFGFAVVGEKTGASGDGLIRNGYIMEKPLAPA